MSSSPSRAPCCCGPCCNVLLRAEGGLQVLDIMAIRRFINTTFMTRKMRMTQMTAQLLVISSKNSSPATRSFTQPCTYARFASFTSLSR
jgi:hypothetical protein